MLKKLLIICILGFIGWLIFLDDAMDIKKAELQEAGASETSVIQLFDN